MKFSVTTFTTQGIISPEALMPKLAAWGYDGIELWAGDMPREGYMSWWRSDNVRIEDVWPDEELGDDEIATLTTYKELAAENGLEIVALAPYFDFTSGKQRWEESLLVGMRYVQYAQFLGCKTFRTTGGRTASADLTDEQWEACISGLRALVNLLGAADMVFALECHRNRPEDTVGSVLREIQEVGADNLRVLFQPTSFIEETALRPMLDALFPYVAHLHMGGDIRNDERINWAWLLPEMARRGYEGFASIEGAPEPKLESLERLGDWLRQVMEA